MNYNKLTSKKSAHRLTMAREIVKLCRAEAPMRVMSEIIMDTFGDPHSLSVRISGSYGLAVTIDFEGKSQQPDVFVLSWHITDSDRGVTIAPGFAQDRNPITKRKATDVCHGFSSLMETLKSRLEWMESGTATDSATPGKIL